MVKAQIVVPEAVDMPCFVWCQVGKNLRGDRMPFIDELLQHACHRDDVMKLRIDILQP